MTSVCRHFLQGTTSLPTYAPWLPPSTELSVVTILQASAHGVKTAASPMVSPSLSPSPLSLSSPPLCQSMFTECVAVDDRALQNDLHSQPQGRFRPLTPPLHGPPPQMSGPTHEFMIHEGPYGCPPGPEFIRVPPPGIDTVLIDCVL